MPLPIPTKIKNGVLQTILSLANKFEHYCIRGLHEFPIAAVTNLVAWNIRNSLSYSYRGQKSKTSLIGPKLRCQQASFFEWLQGRIQSLRLPASSGSQHSLASGHLTLVSVLRLYSLLFFSSKIFHSLPFIRILTITIKAHWVIQDILTISRSL